MNEVRRKGLELFTEIMGEDRGREMRKGTEASGYAGIMAGLAVDFAFGSIWARPGLERKQRSLVTLGVLIAQRQPAELKNHIRIALANGLTKSEIEEAVLQSVPYVGFPAATSATTVMIEVFREAGLDTTTRTPEERGML
jgi:4-carboxymuconolactone decarboxylase